jgi:hypothetical protein
MFRNGFAKVIINGNLQSIDFVDYLKQANAYLQSYNPPVTFRNNNLSKCGYDDDQAGFNFE